MITEGPEQRTAFVFAGGAALGAAHVGMLRAVFEAGIQPDVITGVSVGSWNAAYLAIDPGSERLDEMAEIWRRLSTNFVFSKWPRARAVWNLLAGEPALLATHGLQALATELFGSLRIENLALPVGLITADLNGAVPIMLTDGDLATAVLSSSAIPGVFPPVRVKDRWCTDGAVITNVPLAPARAMGATRYVVFDTGIPCGREQSEKPPSLSELISIVTQVASRQRVSTVLPYIAEESPVLYLSLPCPMTHNAFNFDKPDELIDLGYRAASTLIDKGWDGKTPGVTGTPHEHEIELINPWHDAAGRPKEGGAPPPALRDRKVTDSS